MYNLIFMANAHELNVQENMMKTIGFFMANHGNNSWEQFL